MSSRNWVRVAASLTLVACTQDYDTFDFADGTTVTGGGTTTLAGGAGGTDGVGASGGIAASGGGGSAATTGGASGVGGSPPVDEVPCGSGGSCDLGSGDVCCISESGETNGNCEGSCNPGNEASLACNEPSDCSNGDTCCLVLNGVDYDSTQCKATCEAGVDEVICDPETSEPCSGQCQQVADLPAGFKTCQ